MTSMPKYSIVVPLHNEQENVTDLYDRLKAVMEAHGESFEIVLVDDGSSDGTFNLLREIAAVDSRVTVVKLRRNFGQTAGLAAGFDHARGEYIIAMAEVDAHPIGSGLHGVIGSANRAGSGFILRFPEQEVVVAALAEMEKTADGHQKVERGVELPSCGVR